MNAQQQSPPLVMCCAIAMTINGVTLLQQKLKIRNRKQTAGWFSFNVPADFPM